MRALFRNVREEAMRKMSGMSGSMIDAWEGMQSIVGTSGSRDVASQAEDDH